MNSEGRNSEGFYYVEAAEFQVNTAENINFEIVTDRFISVREITVTKYVQEKGVT